LPQRSDRHLGTLLGGSKPVLRGAEIGCIGELLLDRRQLVRDFGPRGNQAFCQVSDTPNRADAFTIRHFAPLFSRRPNKPDANS